MENFDFLTFIIKKSLYPNYKKLNFINMAYFFFDNHYLKLNYNNNTAFLLNSFDKELFKFNLPTNLNDMEKFYKEINNIINLEQ